MKIWRFLALLSLLLCGACQVSPPLPPAVVDEAEVLSPSARQRLCQQARLLLQQQRIALQVWILPQAVDDLDRLAADQLSRLRLGEQTGGARGLLLVFDPQRQQVRLEVGYDLEALLTDLFIGRIEREQMAPFYAAGRLAEGIEATVELVVGAVLAQEDASPDRPVVHNGTALSGGGGARLALEGAAARPEETPVVADLARYQPQPTPLESLALYLEVLRARIKAPQLPLYSPSSRDFFASWLVTDAQQANAQALLEAHWAEAEVRTGTVQHEQLAVIRFPVTRRGCAPYLLRRVAAGWQLDFAAMHQLLGFNHNNQWFMRRQDHAFMFAFRDWRFDRQGFPHAAP
ncbi:MAG: YgcG family protein [Desulfuromonas sp.]|jgi:hypothetical protein|nr:TPM domain-containing protein [Desulfuromonas thiophila]MDD3801485.1 TPM domain-containing protein [Desulfuromonas thiophila]